MDRATERIAALCAGLTNYERDRPDRPRFTLDSMRWLLARPAAPVLPARLVQVGGSKGKGTTARYLAALAPGARTGIYASPHVETILERVVIDGALVDEELLARELGAVLEAVRTAGVTVSFFEAMTAAALGCFVSRGVELGVLEVGLGGRLDATTAVPVDASVLTSVELEHTELLGDTVEAIAEEKAAIVRPGKLAVAAVLGGARDVVVRRAREVGARLELLGEDFDCSPRAVEGELRVSLSATDGARSEITIAGAPLHEARAVALAWACHRQLDPGYQPPARIARPHGRGCFEVFEPGPIVVDGAHTPESLRVLRDELARRFADPRFALLFGIARGKRWREGLEELLPGLERVWVTELEGTVSEPPEAIRAWLSDRGVAAEVVPDAAAGLVALRRAGGLGVIAGSFYLAGSVLPALRGLSQAGSDADPPIETP